METPSQAFDGKAFSEALTGHCGVYRMLDEQGGVLYVGKARNLKKRVASYFHSQGRLGPKIRSMVFQVRAIEVTLTHTEDEALILESNLIKQLRPRYNVVLRDDKSYPYIYVSSDQAFPRLSFHRGARTGKGRYFGPFPSAGSVRASLNLLQKLFLIRPCQDSFFRNRSRPCLQYQIKRCSAPCVGFIDAKTYQDDVKHAVLFLEGRSQEVINHLIRRMEQASNALEFERAARYRDQINDLKRIQQHQCHGLATADTDIIAAMTKDAVGCVTVFFIRGGHNLGSKTFFPKHPPGARAADILSAFVPQYYLAGHSDRTIPPEILVNQSVPGARLLTEVLSARLGKPVRIQRPARGDRARWLGMAEQNAEAALAQRLSDTAHLQERFEALQEALGLEVPVERIECFDVSHTFGEATVAACVVFGPEGPIKSDYRRFNIEGLQAGDDYGALHQALTRRYARVRQEEARFPDVLLIDGGKGQLNEACEVLASLQMLDVCIVGVAKGPARKPGLETLFLSGHNTALHLPSDSVALHLIQQIRDEAHRFAILGHRKQRAKTRSVSPLEDIEGIGAQRRRHLIQHFGGLQGVARAGVEDLSKVPGISKQLAMKIYNSFRHAP